MIRGTAELASDVLGVNARIGPPMGLSGGLVEEVSDPKYATAVGLVLYGLRPEIMGGSPFRNESGVRHIAESIPGENLVSKIASRMKGWFDEL